MSILPQELRLSTIAQANEYFDHRDRAQHDLELREGAAAILYQKLAFAVHQAGACDALYSDVNTSKNNKHVAGPHHPHSAPTSAMMEASDKEIAMIAGCLEMVHRASADNVASVWESVGYETLPILVRVLERPLVRMARVSKKALQQLGPDGTSSSVASSTTPGGLDAGISRAVGRDMKMAVQKVTKLCAIYSLVPEAKVVMASCPGLLSALVQIIDTQNMNRLKPPPPGLLRAKHQHQQQHQAAASSSAFTSTSSGGPSSSRNLAGLGGVGGSSRSLSPPSAAAADASPSAMVGGGANGIRGSPTGLGLHMTEAARFNAIATLTNLAAAEPNRMVMLAEPSLVDNVARVVHNERSDVARQCAALAIMNLSNGDREHVPELAGNDLILETLLVLLRDDAPETRRNAAVALFNVACADQNTIRLARYRDGAILEALSNLVVTDDDIRGGAGGGGASGSGPHDENDDEARTNAAETLFNMSCSEVRETTDRMADHYGLLENLALTLRSSQASIDVKMYCAATLRRMAEITHAPNPNQGALLTALVKASTWTRTPCIAEAFHAQAELESNRPIVVQHHGLLNALSKLALCVTGDESDRVRRAAVSAIELLSQEASTRRILAHNEGIMMALTRASYGMNPAATVAGSSQRGAGLGLASAVSGDASLSQHHRAHYNAAAAAAATGGGGGGGMMLMNGGHNNNAMAAQNIKQSRRIRVALKNLVAAM